MASRKKKYAIRGLDLRSNHLYREEGTASDCRNVFLDHSRNLIKKPDLVTSTIPRGTDGETGDFLDQLPFGAEILDLVPYEDYIILVTRVRWEDGGNYLYVNKFYKWFEDTNTVEYIPFSQETSVTTTEGQIRNRTIANINGKVSSINQENVLFIVGDKADTDIEDFSYNKLADDNNLAAIHAYDGKTISRTGCPLNLSSTQEDDGNQATYDYLRVLPMKIDALGRFTLGNFTTFKTTSVASLQQEITIQDSQFLDNSYDHHVYCKIAANLNLSAAGDTAARTFNASFYSPAGNDRGNSLSVGQIVYGITQDVLLTPFTPPKTRADVSHELYRATVEAVDYVGGTVTLNEFKVYSEDSGLWEDATSFRHDYGDQTQFLSNIISVLYASSDFAFGFEFRGYMTHGYDNATDATVRFFTTKGGSTLTSVDYTTGLLFVTDEFEDMYDEVTVKLVPPLVNSLINYSSALMMTDHEGLYFTDLSVGGSIEVVTPTDQIPVGSSKRGPISGVFATESFLVVFREEESYYISGNVFLGNYRIQSYYSTRIGCTDARGIVELNGAGMFPSKRGFYVCGQGAQMSEISDSIEPMFLDNELELELDLFNVKAALDFKREYAYFMIESGTQEWVTLAYSYYHNEWFIWDDINGAGGFCIINNKIYASDGINVSVEGSESTASDSYYRSNFETLGEPSLKKKFLQALVFCTSQVEEGDIRILSYKDWKTDEDSIVTDETETLGGDKVLITRRLNPLRCYASAIEILSNSGSSMKVDGYEYEFSADVKMYKDED